MIGRLRRLLQGARRRPRLAALLLTLAALVGLAAYLGGRQLWGDSQYRTIQQALDRRDFAQARALLAQRLQHAPQDAELRLLVARAARRDGDFAEAEKQLAHCRQLKGDPNLIDLERALLTAEADDPARVEGYLFSGLKRPP